MGRLAVAALVGKTFSVGHLLEQIIFFDRVKR
jgi:hypothetical protein